MITDTDRLDWIEEHHPRHMVIKDRRCSPGLQKYGFEIRLHLWDREDAEVAKEVHDISGANLREAIDTGMRKTREFWSRQPDHLKPEAYCD